MGDDGTDEYVFEALVGQGIMIRIGNRAWGSRGAHRFGHVSDTRQLVGALAAGARADSGA